MSIFLSVTSWFGIGR